MSPWFWTILGAIVGLILGVIAIFLMYKRNKKRQQVRQDRLEQVMKEFEYAEKTFAETKEKDHKTPQQILWDIYHNKNEIHSSDAERGLNKNEFNTGTGRSFDEAKQRIGITELPKFDSGRDNLEDNTIPAESGTDRPSKTNTRIGESPFQRRLRERREGRGK